MNKKGFTLMELMVVILIISIASVSSIISFSNINKETKAKEQVNKYIELQEAAILYYELDDTLVSKFSENVSDKNADGTLDTSNDYITISYNDLATSNYVNDDDYTFDGARRNYVVKISVVSKGADNVKIVETSICTLINGDLSAPIINNKGEKI